MSSRWQMCSRCGVKLIKEFSGEGIAVLGCPSCKRGILTVEGKIVGSIDVLTEKKESIESALKEIIKKLERMKG